MEAENVHDPFASIIKLCQLTASLEAKIANCPLARESEMFLDSNDEQLSSSPDLLPSEPTGIVVISLPDSIDQHTDEDDAVFVTPPEHHHNSHLSSSEDQILIELCAQQTKVRVSEVGLDDEPEIKRIKIDEEFDGNIVRLGETEEAENKGEEAEIIVGSGDSGAENKEDEAEIIVLDSDAEEIMATSDLDAAGEAGAVSTVGEIGGLLSNCDAINGNHELGEKVEAIGVSRAEMPNERNVEAIGVLRAEMPNENRDFSESLDSGVMEGDMAKLNHIAAKSSLKVRLRIRGSDKAVKTPKDAKKPKDRHRSRRVRSGRKRIEEIDEFRYDGGCEGRTGRHAGGSGSKQLLPPSFKGKEKEAVESLEKKSGSLGLADRLPPPLFKGKEKEGLLDRLPPPSFKGKEKEAVESLEKKSGSLGLLDKLPQEKEAVESSEKKSGSFDLLDILNTVFGGMDGGCDDDEDVDFLATAKRKGMTFPRPRWWPDGDEEGYPS